MLMSQYHGLLNLILSPPPTVWVNLAKLLTSSILDTRKWLYTSYHIFKSLASFLCPFLTIRAVEGG